MMKYKSYKPSGHIGIGDVPEHWKVKRMKHLGDAIIGVTYSPNDVSDTEEGILVLRSSNIQEGVIAFDDCVYLTKEINPKLITRKGDILICARNGSAHLVGKNICIDENSAGLTFGAFMVVFRGKYWKYLSYFFNSPIFTSQTGMFSTTTINQLTSQTLNNLRIAYPSDETEQELICNYLNEQTQKIDTLIANKKAQAEKLKELRQIEINNAVTKGLNKNVELKESGIEWLGKIPKHWEKRKISTNFKIISSGTTPEAGKEDYYENGKYFWVNTGDLNDCEIYDCEKKITEKAFNEFSTLKLFPINTILIAMYGATIGKVGILKIEATTNQACCALADSFKFVPEYIFFSFIGIKESIIRMSYGGGQPNISQDTIKQLRISCPPIEEQIEIAKHLQQRTAVIDKLIKNTQAQIEKLHELRKIKIYEAVTGKIKVNAYEQATA